MTTSEALPAAAVLPSTSPLLSTQSAIDLMNGNQEFLRLYTEAQTLAAHAAKVEAERKELVEKLAVINSTAAKLFTSVSTTDFPLVQGAEMETFPAEVSVPPSRCWVTTESNVQTDILGSCTTETDFAVRLTKSSPIPVPDVERTESTSSFHPHYPNQEISDDKTGEEAFDLHSEPISTDHQFVSDSLLPESNKDSRNVGGDGNVKKSTRKKSKKTKKKLAVFFEIWFYEQ